MMTVKKTICLVFLFLILASSVPALAGDVNLSVAASMTDAFKSLADRFKHAHPDIIIQYNFGSSGALAKQITQGAPADIFVSANTTWMDYLVEKKKIDDASVRVFARNRLVLAGTTSTPMTSLADLTNLDRIALGSPQSVPAGQYAHQAMTATGIYDTLLSQRKLIMSKDVRQALLYADRGEVDAAFVYKTDALLAKHARILLTVPQETHAAIAYPMALTEAGTLKSEARAYYEFLSGTEAMAVLESFGFETVMAHP